MTIKEVPGVPGWKELLDSLTSEYRKHLRELADSKDIKSSEYRSAQDHLEALMGQSVLSSMWTVALRHHKDAGVWLVSGATWDCLRKCSAVEKLGDFHQTAYQGILGYYESWPIVLFPGTPRYGAQYLLLED